MYSLLRCAADVALRALASAPDEQPPFALVSWVAAQVGGDDPLATRVRALLTGDLASQVSAAPDTAEGLAETVWAAGQSLPPPHAAVGRRRAWWENWLSDTLDRAYATAVTQLAAEGPLGVYFCATENHVLAPDLDMHVALEDDALHLLTLGTQFDLRRPARIAGYQAPHPAGAGPAVIAALQAAGRDRVPLPSPPEEEWQLVRPVPEQTLAAMHWWGRRPRRDPAVAARALVPTNPRNHSVLRSQVRGEVLRAKPSGLLIEHLVLQLDLGQPRPLQLTVFGLREMWAGALIVRRWLGESLATEIAWSDTAWGFQTLGKP